jgi:nicotinamide mononucleotide transporter
MQNSFQILGVGLNLIFVIGLMKQKIWCWPIGILGSLISIYVFIEVKLYSEAILYVFYVLFGIYGWYNWSNQKNDDELKVIIKGVAWHASFIFIGILCALGLGYYFQISSDANNTYEDSFSTIFSFIATYFETKKVLSNWLYWIVLNAFSVYLYNIRGLEIYGSLMIVYFILSIWGFLEWRKSYRASL